MTSPRLKNLLAATQRLALAAERLRFSPPVDFVYNPLDYAWAAHADYLQRFADSKKQIVFVGMNPGPFGMMQTGVPFGEIAAVRDWMGIDSWIASPKRFHPKRPIEGFACARSEVSGRRLWGLFAERFGSARDFFKNHAVLNYCPLAFLDGGGRNLTPDKIRRAETDPLYELCDQHLREFVAILEPNWIIGVGDFAEHRARIALKGCQLQFGKILHPSPASPAANRGWAKQATVQLETLGVW